MNKRELEKLHRELIECSEGQRDVVSVDEARADSIGMSHMLMLGYARAFSLKVASHDTLGWAATRA